MPAGRTKVWPMSSAPPSWPTADVGCGCCSFGPVHALRWLVHARSAERRAQPGVHEVLLILPALPDFDDDPAVLGAARGVADQTGRPIALATRARAARSDVIRTATRHGFRARCVWLDVPLAQAQVNMVGRILDRFGTLPSQGDLRAAARKEPWLLTAASQMRALRELEPPSNDEGFDAVERVAFARDGSTVHAGGVFVAASAMRREGWRPAVSQCDPLAPHLVFDWNPDRAPDLYLLRNRLATVVRGEVEVALCPHPGGPPACWSRPPLPGLPLAFARAHGIDPQRSALIGTSAAHRTLATTLGSRFLAPP